MILNDETAKQIVEEYVSQVGLIQTLRVIVRHVMDCEMSRREIRTAFIVALIEHGIKVGGME